MRAFSSPDPSERAWALDVLAAAYWKPACTYIRLKWRESSENAQDLTQGFFAKAIEKDFFKGYDPARASFRAYLRTCIDHFVSNERKFAGRLKRGGDVEVTPVDMDSVQAGEQFEKEWVHSLFSLAVDVLQQECEQSGKTMHFRLFERYDLTESSMTYDQLAAEFKIPATQVTNCLAWTRRQFRRIIMEKLKQITGGEEEFRIEARMLLGVDPS